jgi:uncharacterized membrane protein YphA (DoxX/SURF4 family)
MIRRLLHPWLTVRAQIALGAVFVAAALPKLADPPGFAEAIWNYQLAPAWLIHPAALALPWLELLCGLALCLGVWVRPATAWLGTLLLVFLAALSINLARNHPVDCGCFHTQASARSAEDRVADMRWAVLRDLGLLALAAQILAAGAYRRKEEP